MGEHSRKQFQFKYYNHPFHFSRIPFWEPTFRPSQKFEENWIRAFRYNEVKHFTSSSEQRVANDS